MFFKHHKCNEPTHKYRIYQTQYDHIKRSWKHLKVKLSLHIHTTRKQNFPVGGKPTWKKNNKNNFHVGILTEKYWQKKSCISGNRNISCHFHPDRSSTIFLVSAGHNKMATRTGKRVKFCRYVNHGEIIFTLSYFNQQKNDAYSQNKLFPCWYTRQENYMHVGIRLKLNLVLKWYITSMIQNT